MRDTHRLQTLVAEVQYLHPKVDNCLKLGRITAVLADSFVCLYFLCTQIQNKSAAVCVGGQSLG